MEYIGEHLLPGQLGHLLVILSFVAALLSTVAYTSATVRRSMHDYGGWLNIGRLSFALHGLATFGIIGSLFFILVSKYYEYHYAWANVSDDLPFQYTFSAFWKEQQGSFLLWSFWHIILGNILLKISDSFQAPVMTVVSSVQVFLSSMLLGVFVFDYRIGSNPFLLLREHPEFSNLPFTKVANYLENLDGRGLNPLLQNYWMTIHPPTLFLGFALTLIPFAYAIAAFWKRDLHSWLKPALPWTFVCIAILGTGILMGGAWAYESLSFGGFWAWDPVENASLVPWLTLVGAGHLMLINKNKGSSLLSVFVLTCLTFVLILYSTFLTRSGILGNTSVHAFTDLGMSGQLLIYLLCYVFLSFFLLIKNRKEFKSEEKEESIFSREFWMFVGALILLISAFQIIFSTSIPVINKIFSSNLAPPAKPIEHYNSWQVPISILICLLIAFTQFLKYKSTNSKEFFKTLSFSFFLSLGLSILVVWQLELTKPFYSALLFTSLFACISNFDYFIRKVKQ
jgi:cytochrome c-type biogenesis protein CcmF